MKKRSHGSKRPVFDALDLPDRRALEKLHADMGRLLRSHDFESADEMNAFLDKHRDDKPPPPRCLSSAPRT